MDNGKLKKLLFLRAYSYAGAAANARKDGSPSAYTLSRIAEELRDLIEDSGLREEFAQWEAGFSCEQEGG